jgi:hypothetical protein
MFLELRNFSLAFLLWSRLQVLILPEYAEVSTDGCPALDLPGRDTQDKSYEAPRTTIKP